jgi:TetR/AcrR family transcriptional repressor of nem operon
MTVLSKKHLIPSRDESPTAAATAILDVAEQLAQTRGYNGFSYADIAAQLGVTKASLHYHFPSKAELGRALIQRYHRLFGAALEAIAGRNPPQEKLKQYVGLYDSVLSNERMCLCGMLAAEYATLPPPTRQFLRTAF